MAVQLSKRRTELSESCEARKAQLTASLHLQQLKRDCRELKQWIADKMKVAQDESFKVRLNHAGRLEVVK